MDIMADNYDYNKPQLDIDGNPMDNTKIIAKDWWLKPMMKPSSVWSHHKGHSGGYISDYKCVGETVRIIGTKLQCFNLFCKMLNEEGWQIKDSQEGDMKEEYVTLYKENKKPIIISLI